MFDALNWPVIVTTLQLASMVTLCVLLLACPLAWYLSQSRGKLRDLVAAVTSLPLVLPPTVLGFYLLMLLGKQGPLANSPIGALAFTFSGIVIACSIHTLPFVVQPLQNAFEAFGKRPLEVAATLGASPWDRFFNVALPLAKPGLFHAAILGFCHSIGEFGVVLMVGGNIPGKTRVIALEIFNNVESLNYQAAHQLAFLTAAFSLVALLLINRFKNATRHEVHP
ncbi:MULTISPECIES: molybdate ABC transporter permease subunit [Aliagarivorans]|uniref:molybdate ABC transporter permease subunit n=1 Tax=Aliagarivorans TaxID=882379 RepID=UPI0004260DFA|nr:MULTISPECIES: molybdate ABC transporter permease subunit [Aliagarivorans]